MPRNLAMDFPHGASNASGPSDLLAAALRKAGFPVPDDPVLRAKWMADRGITVQPPDAAPGYPANSGLATSAIPQLQPGETPITNVLRSISGNIIGPVAGGVAGLASWPFVGSAGASEISQDVTGRLSYTPPAGTQSAALVEGLGSKYNPLTWPARGFSAAADYVADPIADAGFPAVAATVKGAINAAPMLLGMPRVTAAAGRGIAAGLENLAAPTTMHSQRGAVVFHGSPHQFDAFDASKIGTGEGAQAYGHGLYLSDAPSVAKTYQAKVSAMRKSGSPTVAGRPINWDNPAEAAAFEAARHNGDRAAAAEFYDRTFNNPSVGKILRSSDPLPVIDLPGNFYKVDLPDEQIARMLDWDKPLSQQPKAVQQHFEPMVAPIRAEVAKHANSGWRDPAAPSNFGYARPTKLASNYDPSGQELLGLLRNRDAPLTAQQFLGNGLGSDISATLRQQGIPGIRYLDGGSRGAGAGTSNYVVFPGNENMLRILERNGVKMNSLASIGVATSAKMARPILDPPPQPARPFSNDYPSTSSPGQRGSQLTNDIEGRSLTAPLVVGRQSWGGLDVVPTQAQIFDSATSLGATPQIVPQATLGTDLGQYLARKYNAAPEIKISAATPELLRPRVQAHEVGHLIDDIAGGIDMSGLSNELRQVYSNLNTGGRVSKWQLGTISPAQQGYKGADVAKEYVAESIRAYLTDPNYLKTVAPGVAQRIRSYVNAHPELMKTIQFNSAAGAGLLGTSYSDDRTN